MEGKDIHFGKMPVVVVVVVVGFCPSKKRWHYENSGRSSWCFGPGSAFPMTAYVVAGSQASRTEVQLVKMVGIGVERPTVSPIIMEVENYPR